MDRRDSHILRGSGEGRGAAGARVGAGGARVGAGGAQRGAGGARVGATGTQEGATGGQRLLYLGQLATGAVGVVVALAVAFVWFTTGSGGLAFVVLLLSVTIVVAATLVVLWRLERQKSPTPPKEPADYAGELRRLTTSRREIVGAFEIERRRIERDLHDGAQQHLVAATMKVGEAALLVDSARQRTPGGSRTLDDAAALLDAALAEGDAAMRALRRTVSGIHPQVLADLGLEAAIRDMVRHSQDTVTVRCPHPLPSMPEGVVAAAYFFTSEALTNAAKHAPGSHVSVLLTADRHLRVAVVDDGPGGAHVTPGRGLSGMRERLAAFGGTLEISSPPGGPTTVTARIPLLLDQGEPGFEAEWPGTEATPPSADPGPESRKAGR